MNSSFRFFDFSSLPSNFVWLLIGYGLGKGLDKIFEKWGLKNIRLGLFYVGWFSLGSLLLTWTSDFSANVIPKLFSGYIDPAVTLGGAEGQIVTIVLIIPPLFLFFFVGLFICYLSAHKFKCLIFRKAIN